MHSGLTSPQLKAAWFTPYYLTNTLHDKPKGQLGRTSYGASTGEPNISARCNVHPKMCISCHCMQVLGVQKDSKSRCVIRGKYTSRLQAHKRHRPPRAILGQTVRRANGSSPSETRMPGRPPAAGRCSRVSRWLA